MKINIRKSRKEDMPQVLALIRELALFEKAPNEVTNTVEDMIHDGFGEQPVFRCLVAETENKIVGMAIYYTKYSTWKGKGIYLEDIIVTEAFRGNGIGKMLFAAVLTECKNAGANQLAWQVLDWNEPAISFYKKYNAAFYHEWIDCRLTKQQINESI